MCELLIFGGTTEGRELAQYCCACGVSAAVSVATEYGGELLPHENGLCVLVGRLDSDEMAALMRELGCMAVIDATHPYATEVTANIIAACKAAELPYHRLLRRSSELGNCLTVRDMEELVELINKSAGSILSTLGSKELPKLTEVQNFAERVWVRALPTDSVRALCAELGFPEEHLILERGPFTVWQNMAHIELSGASLLVTKESGAAGGFPEKLEAAEKCGIKTAVLARPEEKGSTMEEIKSLIGGMRR